VVVNSTQDIQRKEVIITLDDKPRLLCAPGGYGCALLEDCTVTDFTPATIQV